MWSGWQLQTLDDVHIRPEKGLVGSHLEDETDTSISIGYWEIRAGGL